MNVSTNTAPILHQSRHPSSGARISGFGFSCLLLRCVHREKFDDEGKQRARRACLNSRAGRSALVAQLSLLVESTDYS